MSIAAIIAEDNSITAVINSKTYIIGTGNPRYQEIIEAIKEQDVDKFLSLYSVKGAVEDWGQGDDFRIENGKIYFKSYEVSDHVTKRIFNMIELGLDNKPMFNFLRNLYSNPSHRAVEELYTFLEHKGMPITPDGCFLSYKGVVKSCSSFTDTNGKLVTQGDLVDKHSRQIRNNIGDVITMPRNMVSDNCDEACGAGLHAGSMKYATSWGTETIIVKINPKNVVSIPVDLDHQKLRCCEYEVVALYEGVLDETFDDRFSSLGDDYCGDDIVSSDEEDEDDDVYDYYEDEIEDEIEDEEEADEDVDEYDDDDDEVVYYF